MVKNFTIMKRNTLIKFVMSFSRNKQDIYILSVLSYDRQL